MNVIFIPIAVGSHQTKLPWTEFYWGHRLLLCHCSGHSRKRFSPSHLGSRGPGFLGLIVGFFSEPSSMGFAVGLGRKCSIFPIGCNSQGQGQAKWRDLLMLYMCSVLQTPLNIQGCLLVWQERPQGALIYQRPLSSRRQRSQFLPPPA